MNVLVALRERGWDIYSSGDGFRIVIDETRWVEVTTGVNIVSLQLLSISATSRVAGTARSVVQLNHLFSSMLPSFGSPLQRVRLAENEPASNYGKIASLIGTKTIEAVFDPYLDENGLRNLLTLHHLGAKVDPDVRLLTSGQKASSLRKSLYLQDWISEVGCSSGAIKQMTSASPHRRFMLLSGSQSLIIGLSLNKLGKDEAAHLENDQLDKPFFDEQWASSVVI